MKEFDLSNFDFNKEKNNDVDIIDEKKQKKVVCLTRKTKNIYRRAFSETQLLDLELDFKKDYSYHLISGGDVDMLSYLKLMIRKYKKINYILISTWCMAAEDIFQINDWIKNDVIKKFDIFVGEIFPGTYKKEYELLKKISNGRVVVFRNHSKIISGYSGDNYFSIESSANINTNPRTENACITIDKGLFMFYKDFFDGINGFEKG